MPSKGFVVAHRSSRDGEHSTQDHMGRHQGQAGGRGGSGDDARLQPLLCFPGQGRQASHQGPASLKSISVLWAKKGCPAMGQRGPGLLTQ